MVTVLRYENSLRDLVNVSAPTIFLAGPTVRGNQTHLTSWRFAAIEEFEQQGFTGTLIVPEFTSKTESDKGKFWIPKWEFAGLTGCDCILFWIPRTKELIGLTTNHEMGYWLARNRRKVVYGRPNDSYRNAYLDVMWEIDYQEGENSIYLPIQETLAQAISESIKLASQMLRLNREPLRISVDSPYGAF